METARLRAAQEKMADKQAELDQLRAKRAIEEAERTWRKKEREEARARDAALPFACLHLFAALQLRNFVAL